MRQCRVVVKNMNSTLSALQLGDADQLFTDGTPRRHIVFRTLIIAVMVDSKLDPVIVSTCMLLEDENSDNKFKPLVKQVR